MNQPKDQRSAINANPAQLTFVNSKRLQALREKPAAAQAENPPKASRQPDEDAKTAHLRRLVEQRLTEILALLPTGRQRRLFKIRYRVELDELDAMPVSEVAKLLNVKPGRS